jgi:hypothetical protein
MLDVYDAHVADLGGQDAISQAEASILRRAATITTELERVESRFAAGEGTPTDVDLYQRATNTLRRTLEAVGLQRRQRDVTPSLAEYLARRATEHPSDESYDDEATND